MRKLKHKNLVAVYDVDMRTGQLVLLMEGPPDGSLTDLIKARRLLCLGEVAHLMRQAYKGLAYMHEKNILHRYGYTFPGQ